MNKSEAALQTHHAYSTLKRRGNGRFHVVSTWNIRCVFVGTQHEMFHKQVIYNLILLKILLEISLKAPQKTPQR